MSRLTLSLLGPLQVALDAQPITNFAYNKARALLAYLVVENDHAHPRDAIVGLLWPDMPDAAARTNLRQILTSLRETIGADFLLTTRDTLQFNPASDFDLDVTQFTSLLDACTKHSHRHITRCPVCAARLAEAVILYRGDFLAQLSSVDSSPFEEWLVVKREALHQRAVAALANLAHHHERWGDVPYARRLLTRLIELVPWDEAAHAHLMRLLARDGQRSAALSQYETCRRVLAEQFSVEPAATTQRLYEQIRAGAEPAVIAPTRSIDLPIAPTPLIGREAELAELADLLADPARRLITLVGPGGIGKTRLALAASTANAPIFEDGAAFVNLASLSSTDLLAATILSALGLPIEPATDPDQQLIDQLRSRELLLVLDNFEHLLDGVELIIRLLRQTAKVTLLITSRERLALQAEQVFELDGLNLPAAEQLFIERAQHVQRKFQWQPAAEAITRICQLVEGLPLAIELAASTVGVQACAAIADDIAIGLRTLVTKYRDLPERHRSLWAVFEHSWRLLTRDEQAAFRGLAVFRGGFQLDAAQHVAGATPALLAALIDKSLVQREGDGRYDLHELLRQYGREKLIEAGEIDRAQAQQLVWFLQLAVEAEAQLLGKEQARWLQQLEVENDNLRTVLQWALDQPQVEGAARLSVALHRFWHLRSRLTEGRRWLEQVLAHRAALSPGVHANVLDALARLAHTQADLTPAATFAQQALTLHRESGNKAGMASSLNSLSVIAGDQGDLEAASRLLEESLTLQREVGDQWGIAAALNNLGVMARRQGDYQRARTFLEESLAIRRQLGDQHVVAQSLLNLGNITRHQGDLSQARTFYEQSLALCREIGNIVGTAAALNSLGIIARFQGDYPQAVTLHEESLHLRREIGDRFGVASSLNNLGLARVEQHDAPRAVVALTESLALAREQGDKSGSLSNIEALAEVAILSGRYLEAVTILGAAEAGREALGSPLSPDEVTQLGPHLSQARAQLADATVAAAWQDGRALTLDKAVALALSSTADSDDLKRGVNRPATGP